MRQVGLSIESSERSAKLAQPPDHLLDEILQKLWTYSVFVFAVKGSQPTYCGGATLVAARGTSYLLTAAHVWNELHGDTLALALDPDRPLVAIRHEFVEARFLSGRAKPGWGPDLALVRLPEIVVWDIQKVKAFYNLERARPDPAADRDWQRVLLWTVVGAPGEHSRITPEEAVLRHSLFDTWTVRTRDLGGLDYHDLAFDRRRRPGLPRSYGGVSGRGLWQIPVTVSGDSAQIAWDWSVRLGGVAFWQREWKYKSVIRCHGRRSLERALQSVGKI